MNIWKSKKLKELDGVEIILGQSPSSKSYNKKKNGLPFLQGKAEFGMIYPIPEIYTDTPLKIAEGNDLLLSVRAPVGDTNLSPYKLCIGRGLAAIRFKKDNPKFYFYWFLKNQKHIESLGVGSTFKAITGEQLKKILVPIVELQEQTAIANILSTVDEAIQKADEAIIRTERIKQAMMQKLLSEGIGHKEFKQTKIGRIPKTWSANYLKTVASIRNSSTRNNLTKVANIPMELVSENKMFCDYEVRNRVDIKSYTYCEKGDLLLAKITPSLENGKQGIVPESVPSGVAYATTEVFPIVTSEIDTQLLYYILKAKKFRLKIIASMIGTTGRQRATKKSIEDLLIPIPLVDEQKEIAVILKAIDEKLGLEMERKQRYERIKQGLMDDLLTGKKRIKIN